MDKKTSSKIFDFVNNIKKQAADKKEKEEAKAQA